MDTIKTTVTGDALAKDIKHLASDDTCEMNSTGKPAEKTSLEIEHEKNTNNEEADDLLQKIEEVVKDKIIPENIENDISQSSEHDFLKKIEEIENDGKEVKNDKPEKDKEKATEECDSEKVVVGKLVMELSSTQDNDKVRPESNSNGESHASDLNKALASNSKSEILSDGDKNVGTKVSDKSADKKNAEGGNLAEKDKAIEKGKCNTEKEDKQEGCVEKTLNDTAKAKNDLVNVDNVEIKKSDTKISEADVTDRAVSSESAKSIEKSETSEDHRKTDTDSKEIKNVPEKNLERTRKDTDENKKIASESGPSTPSPSTTDDVEVELKKILTGSEVKEPSLEPAKKKVKIESGKKEEPMVVDVNDILSEPMEVDAEEKMDIDPEGTENICDEEMLPIEEVKKPTSIQDKEKNKPESIMQPSTSVKEKEANKVVSKVKSIVLSVPEKSDDIVSTSKVDSSVDAGKLDKIKSDKLKAGGADKVKEPKKDEVSSEKAETTANAAKTQTKDKLSEEVKDSQRLKLPKHKKPESTSESHVSSTQDLDISEAGQAAKKIQTKTRTEPEKVPHAESTIVQETKEIKGKQSECNIGQSAPKQDHKSDEIFGKDSSSDNKKPEQAKKKTLENKIHKDTEPKDIKSKQEAKLKSPVKEKVVTEEVSAKEKTVESGKNLIEKKGECETKEKLEVRIETKVAQSEPEKISSAQAVSNKSEKKDKDETKEIVQSASKEVPTSPKPGKDVDEVHSEAQGNRSSELTASLSSTADKQLIKFSMETTLTRAESENDLPSMKIENKPLINMMKYAGSTSSLNTTPVTAPNVFNSTPIQKQFEISSENVSKISETTETSRHDKTVEDEAHLNKSSKPEFSSDTGSCTSK